MNNSYLKIYDNKGIKHDNNKFLNAKVKQKAINLFKPLISKSYNKYINRQFSTNGSFITHSNNNVKLGLNNSRIVSDFDFKEIEQEMKSAVLEMKNNCLLEIDMQSYTNIEKPKKNQIKEKLNEEIKDSQISDINKFIKSKTHCVKNINNYKIRNETKKKNNSINDGINIDSYKCLKQDSKINKKKSIFNSQNKKLTEKSDHSERFRFYGKGRLIEESYNESQSEEEYEEDRFLINPQTIPFLIYDTIILFASFYCLIFIPYDIISECICLDINKTIKFYINYYIDILFIIDLFINFFVEYYSKKGILIKKRTKIINNYLIGWFLFDFLTALPFNLLYFYYCNQLENQICITYENNNITYYLSMLKCLKSMKMYKMLSEKKNQFITRLIEKASNKQSLDEKIELTKELSFVIFGFHIFSCLHIFIGKYAYPSWIFANEFQNISEINIYIISLYYLIQTMTTVGYGDISSDSFIEIIFRIILLAVGIICYSWVISNISNSINKQSYAQNNYSNDCLLLENIRKEHEDLSFKIYNEIKHYLRFKHFQKNIYDKNLLINSLPFTFKNNLIFSMFKNEINRFNFFKGVSNTNFISEILYNFSSMICKKNEILLNENEIIEELFFVKDGRISLELPIDMEYPEIYTKEYLSEEFMNFAFNFEIQNDFKFEDINISKISSLLEEKKQKQLFLFKNDKFKNKEEPNFFDLKIFDVHKDEYYGGIYIFCGKRSPFMVRVRSKMAKLYTIKREDFLSICDSYKNIIKRIHKKEKKNLKIIKNALIKTIDRFCSLNGIKIDDEYKEKIDKAIKEINKSMLPDILKNTALAKNFSNDEIDEEINKTIKEYANQNYFLKKKTVKAKNLKSKNVKSKKYTKTEIKRDIINRKSKRLSNIMNKSSSSLNNLNFRARNSCSNYNYHGNLGVGINMYKPLRNKYVEDLNISKFAPSLHLESINQLIKIKKRYSQPIFNYIKKKISSNVQQKNIISETVLSYNGSENSSKTIKINDDSNNDSKDSYPITINSLPVSLKNKIKEKIKNRQILKNKISKFKIEHISIQINDKNIVNNNNNNNIKNKNNLRCNINNNNINTLLNESKNTNSNSNSNNIKYFRIKSEKKKNLKFNLSPKNKKMAEINNVNKNNRNRGKSYTFKNKGKISPNQSLLRLTLSTKHAKSNDNSPTCLAFQKNSVRSHKDLYYFNDDLMTSHNLSSTSAESFEIKRTYKNLGRISGGGYAKDKKIQKKVIKLVKEYYKKKNKLKRIKTKLNSNLDIQKIKSHGKEENQLKKVEDNVKVAVHEINDILLNKKKKKKGKIQNKKIYTIKSSASASPKNKKREKQKLSLNLDIDKNNSNLRLNSLYVNQDESLGKLNTSNNEIIKLNLLHEKKNNSIFQLNNT